MAYRGPDISSHQGDIDITALSSQVDFFIFRSHYGLTQDSKANRNISLAMQNGKPFGLYIYSYALNTARAAEEAKRVIEYANSIPIKPKFLVIDMEDADGYKARNGMPSNQTLKDICTVECEAFEKAGYYAMIYASTSWFKNQLAGLNRFDRWVAHWPVSGGKQKGNAVDPSGESDATCGIWQFTSEGRLNGYNGNLDMNYCYKDILVKGNNTQEVPKVENPNIATVSPSGTTLELAYRVMKKEFGDDVTRKNNLGARYEEVQGFINHIFTVSLDTLVEETKAGKYGNNPIRSTVLGARYQEVQDRINNSSNSSNSIIHIVQSRDTLSAIASKYGTTVNKIASDNNIANPNIIYVGQRLVINK